MKHLLEQLLSGQSLNAADIDRVFDAMLGSQLKDAQIGAFLAAWRLRGEGVQELLAGARALRRQAKDLTQLPLTRPLIDNCGTGGDQSGSFNLSTAAAIVAAACGAVVAKHGNRSVSSQCGSADLLFAAGFPETLTPEAACQLLHEVGFTFFFAPNAHPVMRGVAPVRQALGVRTIFNLLGPLANPVRPEFQVVGVGKPQYLRPMAEALVALGLQRALVVHSADGLDEISPAAPTDAMYFAAKMLRPMRIEPTRLGLAGASLADLRGGSPAVNLQILQNLLAGEVNKGLADAVALNAGAVLWVAERADDLRDGLEQATAAIASGAAQRFFTDWIRRAQSLTASAPNHV